MKQRLKNLAGVFAGVLLSFGMAFAQQGLPPVMLGGTGENPHLQTVLDGIADMLSGNDVKVKVVSGEAKARSVILDEIKTTGATVLLYATVNQERGQRGKLLVQCFVDGKQAWEEEARGSLTAVSAEGEVKGMVKVINEKLKKRIGQAGLQKS